MAFPIYLSFHVCFTSLSPSPLYRYLPFSCFSLIRVNIMICLWNGFCRLVFPVSLSLYLSLTSLSPLYHPLSLFIYLIHRTSWSLHLPWFGLCRLMRSYLSVFLSLLFFALSFSSSLLFSSPFHPHLSTYFTPKTSCPPPSRLPPLKKNKKNKTTLSTGETEGNRSPSLPPSPLRASRPPPPLGRSQPLATHNGDLKSTLDFTAFVVSTPRPPVFSLEPRALSSALCLLFQHKRGIVRWDSPS